MKILTGPGGAPLLGPSGALIPAMLGPIASRLPLRVAVQAVEGVDHAILTVGTPPDGAVAYLVTLWGTIGGQTVSWPLKPITVISAGTQNLGTAEAVLGPFAAEPWSDVTVLIEYDDGNFGPVARIAAQPAPPGPLLAEISTSATSGAIDVTLLPPLPDAGDGNELGDNAGGTLTAQYRLDGSDDESAITQLGDGVVEEATKQIVGLSPEELYGVEVRAVSEHRAGPWSPMVTVPAGGTVVVTPPPTFIGGTSPDLPLVINMVAGGNLSVNVRAYFTGEDSAAVISGISGGVYADPFYTRSGVAEGTYTLQMTGTNAGGTVTGTISVVAAAAVIAPSLKPGAAWPDFVMTVGTPAQSHNFAQYFDGSDPKTFSSPQDAGDALFTLSTAGQWQTTALTTLRATGAVEVVCTNAAGSASLTFDFGVVSAARPPKLTVGAGGNVVTAGSYNRWPGYRTDRLTATGLAADCVLEWSTSNLGSDGEIAEANWEVCTVVGSYFEMFMRNPDRNISPEGQPASTRNYSVFGETATENTRAGRRRFRQKNTETGMASVPSEPLAVPAVPVDPVVTGGWLPAVLRYKRAWQTGNVGNPGQQFERVVAWNQGVLDVTKRGDLFGGQDENNLWMMTRGDATGPGPDGIALFGSPVADGAFVSNMGGIYANSDDNIVLALGNGGLFRSDDWTKTFYEVVCMRGSVKGLQNVAQGSSTRNPMNQIWRRPQRFVGGVPQLSHAERPIWVLEQVKGAGNAVVAIYVWWSLDNGQSFEMRRELSPASDYVGTSKSQTLKYITVAPNGDVMICGNKSVWRSTDNFATAPTKCQMLGNLNNRDVVAVGWRGGDHNTPSGAYAAISNAGVVRTDNIRTTGFTRPAGQDSDIASYGCVHMGVSPANPDRLIICGGAKVSPRLSTDGGVKFSVVTSNAGTGDGTGRYHLGADAGTIHFHPTLEDIVFATTGQTVTRSVDGGASFNGDHVAFFDGSHDKGHGFDPQGDWKKFCVVQQDYVLRWSNAGFDYFKNSGIDKSANYGQGAVGANFGAKHLSNLADAIDALGAGGAASGGYTSGNGAVICPNGRFLVAVNANTGNSQNVIVIEEDPTPDANPSTTSDGEMRHYLVRDDIDTTRASNNVNHPDDTDMVFMGSLRITNLDAPSRDLPADPFKYTHGSSLVEVTFPNHGYQAGSIFPVSGSNIFRGTDDKVTTDDIVIRGRYPVASVVNSNTFRIDVGVNVTIAGGAGQTRQAGGNRVRAIGQPTIVDMTRQIVEMFKLGGSTISYWINDGGSSSAIHRSTAGNGGGQELWYTAPNNFKQGAICVDAFQAERVLYSRNNLAQNGIIREVRRVGANLTDLPLKDASNNDVNLRSLARAYLDSVLGEKLSFTGGSVAPIPGATITKGGVSGVAKYAIVTSGSWGAGTAAGYVIVTGRAGGNFTSGSITSGMTATISGAQQTTYTMPDVSVDILISDRNCPGFFLALLNGHGVPNVWQSIDDGVTWLNVSDFLPRTIWNAVVHPYTGCRLLRSSKGRFTGPPVSTYPSRPDKGKAYDQVEAFYARPEVPNPWVY